MSKKSKEETKGQSVDLLQNDPVSFYEPEKGKTGDNMEYELRTVEPEEIEELEPIEMKPADKLPGLDGDDTDDFEETTETKVENDNQNQKEVDFKKTEEEIAKTDIDAMFAIASSTVSEAKSIFAKNNQVKKRIDEKIEELEQLKKDFEKQKEQDFQKIRSYKEEVYNSLKQKKEAVERQVSKLKNSRSNFEQEKEEFEKYKQDEMNQIKAIKAKQKKFFEEKQNELDNQEHDIRLKLDLIEEEKRKLELDRIKYDADKNELSNNLLKFNELVSDFTINIDRFNDD